jgi:hypothetical protein
MLRVRRIVVGRLGSPEPSPPGRSPPADQGRVFRRHPRPHSGRVRLHPWAMWSAMQASCCDHGFRPRRLARHVTVSPVRGFCTATSVAQPVSRHAAMISIGYRKGVASSKLGAHMAHTAHDPPLSRRRALPRPSLSTPPRSPVRPPANRRVAPLRGPSGSTSPHPAPGRALRCRRSGWPGPARA